MKKVLPIIFIINTSLFIITLAISIPILFRPFYYVHINALDLPKETGYKYSEIKEAYDDVLDYCVLNKEFSTGKLKYSNEGMDHFKDCRTLFIINFSILFITIIILIIKKKYCNQIKLFKHNISFWSSCLLLSIISIILIITLSIGFDRLYEIFHNIFFLGKDNWLFNPNKDEIIKILPQRFFMNCGILIVSVIVIISITLIIKEIYIMKKTKKNVN